jgi:hypothetical protein
LPEKTMTPHFTRYVQSPYVEGILVFQANVVDNSTSYAQRVASVVVTISDDGDILLHRLSGKIGSTLNLRVKQTLSIDVARWQNAPEATRNMYCKLMEVFTLEFLSDKRRDGFTNDSCFINGSVLQLFGSGLNGIFSGNNRFIHRAVIPPEVLPAFYDENNLLMTLRGKTGRKTLVPKVRLSKEDWLKQNYPGMTELPKWRFPGLAG